MRVWAAVTLVSLLVAAACDRPEVTVRVGGGGAGIDSLNARLERSYAGHDAKTYATLFTDSAVFEWPATPSVRGRAALQSMAGELWPPLQELKLRVIPNTRRLATDHATELGAFEESWRDSTGGRTTEYGRYAAVMARQKDGSWQFDRWMGFSDSTRTTSPAK
jgi:ketosteroid isomerase-like protein